MRWFGVAVAVIAVAVAVAFALLPGRLERSMNQLVDWEPAPVSARAQTLHASLTVADLHADSTLWLRDLRQRGERGHVDLPRLREGNVALQAFTFVTRSPRGQNYVSNDTDALDNITLLAVIQRWPLNTWSSLAARALYQAERLSAIALENPGELQILRTRSDVNAVMQARSEGADTVGALLGIEGAHALDANLWNIQRLKVAGVRMFGLHHFFDNALGGSLHGTGGGGLSDFGREVVEELDAQGLLIDVAHSSEQSVRDVLALSDTPLIVSHTGFQGHCASPRNISDALMQQIAQRGGLVGVGFWDGAVCEPTLKSIVGAIRYGIDLLGVEHVALGSDYDGSTTVPFDASELSLLTGEMLQQGFSEAEIRSVMGENMLRFLRDNLPSARG